MTTRPGRCMIVANQTVGSEALDRAVRDCIERGVTRFFVVVPATPVKHESTRWTGGYLAGDPVSHEYVLEAREEDERRRQQAEQEAQQRARLRLTHMLDRVAADGGDATGAVGDADPLTAAQHVLDAEADFDEIIVSTLPAGLSRWLGMDLPSRFAKSTYVPVTTVEADE